MMKQALRGIVFCYCLMNVLPVFAQPGGEVKDVKLAQVDSAIALYGRFTNAGLPIYNGGGYIPFNFKREGNPFFGSDSLTTASIGYEGRYYRHIPVLFDITRNQLAIASYNEQSLIVLVNDKVDSFHLSGHRFIRLHHYDSISSPPVTGFYDLLYDGRLKIWARRTKNFQENTSGRELVRIFYPRNYYYIFKNNTYYPVGSKRDVLAILPEKRHEIKKYARRHKLKFNKKEFDHTITAVAAYYDQLTP